jgi:hypothetical protein
MVVWLAKFGTTQLSLIGILSILLLLRGSLNQILAYHLVSLPWLGCKTVSVYAMTGSSALPDARPLVCFDVWRLWLRQNKKLARYFHYEQGFLR